MAASPRLAALGSRWWHARWLHRFVVAMLLVLAGSIGTRESSGAPTPATTAAATGAHAGLERRRAWLRRFRGADPRAALGLLGIVHEVGDEVGHERLLAFVRAVAQDSRRDPLVRSLARQQQARLLEQAGEVESAQRMLERDGHLLAWQYVGPFDNSAGGGHARAFGPEALDFAPDQAFTGKLAKTPLQWRVYDHAGLPQAGYVSFDEFIQPNTEAVAYATTWVHVPKETPAALHFGSGGAYRIWVNGSLVGSGDDYRTSHPLQDVHPLPLRAGWNRLLVKVAVLSGRWGFYARISQPDGTPAPVKVSAEPPAVAAKSTSAATPASVLPARSLRGLLEARYENDPAAGVELLEFYRWVRPFSAEDRTPAIIAAAVDDRVGTSRTAWLRSILDPDSNQRRRFLEVAVARARAERSAHLPRLLVELAWREAALGLEYRSRQWLEQAAALDPGDVEIAMLRVDERETYGFHWTAVGETRAIMAAHPHSRLVRERLAQRLTSVGQIDEALQILAGLAADDGLDRTLAAQRIELLLRRGRADEAVTVARGLARALPGLPDAHARVAALEAARGDLDAARVAHGRAIALAPQDPDLHAEMAQLSLRAGDRASAVASLQQSLELRPQQPRLADLLQSLGAGAGHGDLLARYDVPLERLGSQPTPPAWQGKDAGFLHHRIAVKVLDNGLTERLDHRIIRILDDRGVRSQSVQAMVYDPAESMVEVRRSRVRRRDGTIEDLGETRVVSLAQAGYRLYYDQREIQVHVPGLRVGDTLEIAFLLRDVAATNKFHEYFGDLVPLQGSEPRGRVEYVLEAPADKPLHFNVEVERRRSKDGKVIVYRHHRRNVPGIRPEPGMPGWTEIADYLHVSTTSSWNEIGRWYWNLVEEQLVVDDAIRRAAREVTAESTDLASKVDAIYDHVVRNTRYVGLEFGIHGYKPYRTTDVYARRFGDCKDKASLLKVMLEEVGIESSLVLVRTRDQGALPARPASVAAFNHAIVYVPAIDRYLDGTAEWSGPTELPANDQGATALIVADGGDAELRTIPFAAASSNVRRNESTVQIFADGRAHMEHRLHAVGAEAGQLRYLFASQEERRERVAKVWGDLFPGAEVIEVAAPDIDKILRPVRLDTTLEVPAFARLEKGRLRFRALGRRPSHVDHLAARAKRAHDLVLGVPSVEHERVVYRLARGLRLAQAPASTRIDTPVGRFVLEVESSPTGAVVSTTLEFPRARIEADAYPQFRRFLADVDAALEQTFEVEVES